MYATARTGTLFLVVGPRGAGKDSVVEGARRSLSHDPRFSFPRRIITTAQSSGNEVHQTMTPAQFDELRRTGAFSFCWGSRGKNFAIPASIDEELAAGRSVVVNVSSQVIGQACRRFPRIVVVEITAPRELRAERLAGQQRPAIVNDDEESFLSALDQCDDVIVIHNDGRIEAAVDRLVGVLIEGAPLRPVRRPAGEMRPPT